MTRRMEPADERSIEREVRQLLCNKISGNFVGIWLLIAEHLRLGAWDLLRHWSGKDSAHVEPRIGLQLVHEAALCIAGKRQKRTLGQQGFEVANGHMTMALIAQASIHMLRQRLGEPIARWDAKHLARDFFHGLEGDVRVHNNTIIVTYYNAPNADILEKHYTHLPARLAQEGVDPKVPWLYDYKLDFRFK